ncbi:ion transporter [Alloiococcus sp. CFN-8]|uniref:ion transporter n=1 Tax=Alloiococcus sp. CFN-8 TaxID=3416081 RepID=UPI003CED9948
MEINIIKKKIFKIIDVNSEDTAAEKVFNYILASVIILSVIVMFAETFNNISPIGKRIINTIEIAVVIIFTIEYILRFYTADILYPYKNPIASRLKYMISFIAIIDLLAFLPFYLATVFIIDLRVFRFVRVLRIFGILKIHRFTDALGFVNRAIGRKKDQLLSSLFVVFVLMIMVSVIMFYIENPVQPEVFKNGFSGLWWAIVTLTAVGYGDIYPVTFLGQVLGSIISILGIGLVAVPTGIISSGFTEELEEERRAREKAHKEKDIEVKE